MKKYIGLFLMVALVIGQFVEVQTTNLVEHNGVKRTVEGVFGGYFLGYDEEGLHMRCKYYIGLGRLTEMGGQELWVKEPYVVKGE